MIHRWRCTCIACTTYLGTMAVFALANGNAVGEDADVRPPNVVFIAIDDMNDWTGFLNGHPQAVTPNLDALAARGVNFTNAHCSAPACSPSRLSLLYGIEPFRSGLYPFYDHAKIPTSVLAERTSLPEHFRRHGYRTFGAGKIFHGTRDRSLGWDDYHEPSDVKLHYDSAVGYQIDQSRKMAFCSTTNPPEEHPDHQVASYGIDIIGRSHDQPYFLAVGIVKPHLAFVCPDEFFDGIGPEIESPNILATDLDDVPLAGRSMASLRDDFRFREDRAWNEVRRAYLACIRWADHNIGRVIDAVGQSSDADNTIVVVWSDHGYHLGEKRSFRKFSLWEEATRVPLIIHDPRRPSGASGDCDQAVSLVHVYRTLCELADLPIPETLDGVSLVPQLDDPSTPLNVPAITTWGRGNYAIRTDHFRYIRYFDGSEELYDTRSDPNQWNNLASHDEASPIIRRLRKHLPENEAPLVRSGVTLWNVIDADRPQRLESFRKKTWQPMLEKLQPDLLTAAEPAPVSDLDP